MILPESRNQFTSKKQRKNLGKKLLLPAGFVAVVVVVTWQWTHIKQLFVTETEQAGGLEAFWAAHPARERAHAARHGGHGGGHAAGAAHANPAGKLTQHQRHARHWEAQQYEEINSLCEQLLAKDPFNTEALLYNGFSYFYRGVNQFSFEEKIALFDRSVANLRKALLLDIGVMRARTLYLLGKAYYYKGKYYADLTIEYLLKAEEYGYVGDDTYEYLGLAYNSLGDYDRSAESFLKAVTQEPTDMRYLALAQAYFNQGLADRSEEYLLRTLNETEDPAVEERTRFLLGKIYMETEQLVKAEDQYRLIIERDPNSADAYFFLGEIYRKRNKETEARYYWRRAHRIDASHYGARLRLF